MKKSLFIVFLLLSVSMLAKEKIKVAIDNFPPFSITDDGKIRGFDIDLINSIAEENGWEVEFVVKATVKDIIETVKNKKADIGISGVSITSDREEVIDFSYPYFNSNLRLLVNKKTIAKNTQVWDRLLICWPLFRDTMIVFFLVLTVFSHVIWVIERFNGDEINFSRHYLKGIGQAYWWSLVTSTTVGYGDITPKKLLGRIIASMVMVCGIIWFGIFTGSVSSMLTLLNENKVNFHLSDLNDKTVVTKPESTAFYYLKDNTLVKIKTETDIIQSCTDVANGKVDAVFFDEPALIRYSSMNNDVVVVGEKIMPQDYGIVMEEDSKYDEVINRSILKMKKDGRLKNINKKWFKK